MDVEAGDWTVKEEQEEPEEEWNEVGTAEWHDDADDSPQQPTAA